MKSETLISSRSIPIPHHNNNKTTTREQWIIDSTSMNNQVIEISERPDFRIITSLLWIRTSENAYDALGKAKSEEHLNHFQDAHPALCQCRPDLGLLSIHRDRLAQAAKALRWRDIAVLDKTDYALNTLRESIQFYLRCLPDIKANRIERRKLRITISKDGSIHVDSTVIDTRPRTESTTVNNEEKFIPETFDLEGSERMPQCRVIVDNQATMPSLFTTHKTSYRSHYDAARKRVNVAQCLPTERDVLLFNQNGEIIETSLCTVYFHRDGCWITPAAVCGSMLGVTRRLALDRGLCRQGLIDLSELQDGETIWLSNGARGFFLGRISLTDI